MNTRVREAQVFFIAKALIMKRFICLNSEKLANRKFDVPGKGSGFTNLLYDMPLVKYKFTPYPNRSQIFLIKPQMKMMRKLNVVIFLLVTLSSCGIVRPGEVGVKQRFGKIIGDVRDPGAYLHNPFTARIVKVPTRTINMPTQLSGLPTKEGLTVTCELAVLFHIEKEYAVKVVKTVGVRNGEGIIQSVLRSAVADVTATFLAKDLHTSERRQIETAIEKRMTTLLGDRGFVVEAILLKSIQLPRKLSNAIEEKLEAEQRAQTMRFELEREKQEAERVKIQAEGIRDAQKIIAEGLSDLIIKYQSIQAFKELSKSNNAKVIITDGKAPFLINE